MVPARKTALFSAADASIIDNPIQECVENRKCQINDCKNKNLNFDYEHYENDENNLWF